MRRSLGVGIPEIRRPVEDSGRLKSGVVRPSSSWIERIEMRDSGREGVEMVRWWCCGGCLCVRRGVMLAMSRVIVTSPSSSGSSDWRD